MLNIKNNIDITKGIQKMIPNIKVTDVENFND
jgi:hypothetical protein